MAINQQGLADKTMSVSGQSTGTVKGVSEGKKRQPLKWQTWAAIMVIGFGTVGFTATSLLLKLPKTPNCPSIFWPFASASMRLYCAQLEAEKGTEDSLLRAINLVEALPSDHPLRTEIDRNIEQWSVDILAKAEEHFQAGDLEKAITTAKKIPQKVHAYNLVEKRITRWKEIWGEGERIFAEVEEFLRESSWNQAFRSAVQLLNINNEYWATVKYDETVSKIQLAKEESSKLDGAYAILRRGGLDNWLKAIEEAQKISSSSYAYREAQKLITKAKDNLLAYVQDLIDNHGWYELRNVTEKIPENLNLTEEVKDWESLADAGIDAQTGTVNSLQAAILSAEEIDSTSPLYGEAQQLISTWKQEVNDITVLTKARELVGSGSINELNAAINQAQTISQSNPRYQEARQEIRNWNQKIQVLEDQPILDQARLIASQGDLNSLQEAINYASRIASGRALYSEAQNEIGQWRGTIQRQEDQPILDQAMALANVEDYQAAVDTASQIQRGRFLYRESRRKIARWQGEVQAQKDLQEAYLIAQAQTSESLVTAITIVRRIPSYTNTSSQGRQALDRWSYQLLAIANEQSAQSIEQAIRLARIIPSESGAYQAAQAQIQVWRKLLQPPVITPIASPSVPETEPSPEN